MIAGDEGKPMSILERISDEPCEPEPFVDYLIANYRAGLDYWRDMPNDRDPEKPTARECVLSKIDGFIMELEDLKRKMHRPARPDAPPVAPREK